MKAAPGSSKADVLSSLRDDLWADRTCGRCGVQLYCATAANTKRCRTCWDRERTEVAGVNPRHSHRRDPALQRAARKRYYDRYGK